VIVIRTAVRQFRRTRDQAGVTVGNSGQQSVSYVDRTRTAVAGGNELWDATRWLWTGVQ